MASPTNSRVPRVLDSAPAAPDSSTGKAQAATSGPAENGGMRILPADATAVADLARSPTAAPKTQPTRSTASLAWPSVAPAPAPAYDGTTDAAAPSPFRGAAASPLSPATPTTTTTTSALPSLRSALRASSVASGGPASPNPAGPYRTGSPRGSSFFGGERASVLERRANEAQAALETASQLEAEIAAVEGQVLQVERELESAQRAAASGGSYRGKGGAALAAEEERLARKERLLREEKGQLREERLVILRSRSDQQRRGSEASVAARPKRVSFIMTQAHVDDPAEEREEQERLDQIGRMITRRQSITSSGGSDRGPGEELEDFHDSSSVKTVYPREEDSRLLVRLQAFGLPVLVGTLLSGFTLVLFDVATTDLARRLAVLAFALEISSSTVLCLIMFRGQQLYSYATDVKPRARKFLRSMCNATILSLIMFSLGVVAFVVSFVVEASSEMGDSWLAVLAVVLFPTVLAAVLFAASTEQVRRFSLPPACGDTTE